MGLCQFWLSLRRFFVLPNRSRPPVFGKQAIAIDDQLCDQREGVLGWRERFILRGLR